MNGKLTKGDCDDLVHKKLKDIENKVSDLKNNQFNISKLHEINELFSECIKLKEKISNVYFQLLRHSSIIIYEKKIKEITKELDNLKHEMIKNESNIECQNINQNFDDDFFIPKNYCIGEDPEHNELIDMPVDLNKHNLSFQNDKNIKIIRGIGEGTYSSLLINNMNNCEIIFLDILSSVFIQNITNCTIWIPAVESSLLIYNCVDCNILVNSKQIRIHNSVNTNFYINSMSSPIIESSEKLFFFPYNLNFDELPKLLEKININRNSNKWKEVLDFSWQNTQNPSPNFNISNDTQIYEVKLKKKESVEHSQEHEINNKYIIENFPLFLKKLD
ncbi:tubulin binding cofactor c, putative [Plasmodium berghei]|uniref:Tubulin binding cofactor c, putative n=2 Tax=Plasmodium berghei TaxID=5821 RepID=A0A509ANB1_PLABA|nr:tubulin binding cofactor c, putative [Plasmodium berghei ANKA]CXI75687.1 tubulin binding cofactor c, putative [Plasmodium berghei]SCM24842.1 tubulin binding cofactor c, putative [Plasmodium berghei]SCN27185.1 tubulin binding cofactor c, putative [Plasmodium berghei]SCO61738.1 tubulin binding cofactor c, putative [Plasmodium berghei]SCO63608.1 tubulin binding cofactor c, putative [Plasmodium berghei]|eukprot:XP_034422819.1 tubulin binding cofactor c, putative [Plasmodium berghei ANKA]